MPEQIALPISGFSGPKTPQPDPDHPPKRGQAAFFNSLHKLDRVIVDMGYTKVAGKVASVEYRGTRGGMYRVPVCVVVEPDDPKFPPITVYSHQKDKISTEV